MKMKKKTLNSAVQALLMFLIAGSALAAEEAGGGSVDKPMPTDQQVFTALNLMAIPIGPKGMVIKDHDNCLWVLKNSDGVPRLAAVLGETSGKQLCGEDG